MGEWTCDVSAGGVSVMVDGTCLSVCTWCGVGVCVGAVWCVRFSFVVSAACAPMSTFEFVTYNAEDYRVQLAPQFQVQICPMQCASSPPIPSTTLPHSNHWSSFVLLLLERHQARVKCNEFHNKKMAGKSHKKNSN